MWPDRPATAVARAVIASATAPVDVPASGTVCRDDACPSSGPPASSRKPAMVVRVVESTSIGWSPKPGASMTGIIANTMDVINTIMHEQHGKRLSGLDSLLPVVVPLPETGRKDVELEVPGGQGRARLVRADPATLDGTWNPAERHMLIARIGEQEPAASMDALLAQWSTVVHDRAGEAESAAVLN